MKTLHSLTQPISHLRRKSEHIRAWLSFRVPDLRASVQASDYQKQGGKTPNRPSQSQRGAQAKGRRRGKSHAPAIWVLAVASLTGVMGHRYYNQPKLDVGKEAPQTIRAPFEATVEDSKTTEEKRNAARNGFIPVLMVDRSLTQETYQELEQYLDEIEALREASGDFPFVNTAILSDATQRYLRQSREWEWQAISALAQSNKPVSPLTIEEALPEQREEPPNLGFTQAVSELQGYRRLSSPRAYSALMRTISQARQQYAQAQHQLSDPHVSDAIHLKDTSVLEWSEQTWQETRRGITQAAKRILTQGIPPGLPPDILKEAIEMQVNTFVPPESEALAVELLAMALQPNLTEDKEQTKLRAEQAAQALEPVMVSVRRGEVIVEEGEEITQADFVLLDYFNLSRREISWFGLVGFGSLVIGGVGIFWLVERRVHPSLRQRDRLLVLLLTLSTPILITFGIPFTSLPAIGLLVGSFYGSALGATVVGLLTGLVSISMDISWVYLLAGTAGGLLGALTAGRLRSREELALLGVGVGLTEGTVYLILNLILSASAGSIWYTVLREAALYGLAGLSWSIVALGLSPYLERLFDLVTPIRLAELSNPNRPLLKRLATEAPGTFQHTLFVASLAEAAARELHCNVELVRAGTLYHDIGKMHDPLGFIENQMGGPNKHDEIKDPWKSAEIIKKHVSEGLVMARKHQLPKAIRDFIPEHQGELLISYFYFQAQQRAQQEGGESVNEDDFRYDGPIPQSRETGVVMLADACEAALRSLKEATPETALSMVNKILKARWQDNQLVDSGLTREELSVIAEVFVRVWQQCNHQRIAYPKAALNCQASAK
jgi:hypothetical protein